MIADHGEAHKSNYGEKKEKTKLAYELATVRHSTPLLLSSPRPAALTYGTHNRSHVPDDAVIHFHVRTKASFYAVI